MIVTTYGTRGSVPVAGKSFVKYGGNTTCIHVASSCLPANTWLVTDAGTGILPLNNEGLKHKVSEVIFLFTHYHHDHTQGLLLTPWTYMKNIKLHLYGPQEHGIGPKQMLEHVMQPPYHPVCFREFASHMEFKSIKNPAEMLLVIHPEGGFKLCPLNEIEVAENGASGQITFMGQAKYSLAQCLVIRMYRSNHPERTISYRFEERPTGKVFVFLTDYENLDSTPRRMLNHLAGADLLIMDSQYDRDQDDASKAGFGHGTPDFCVGVAHQVEAKQLGLTHHDPNASDQQIDKILNDAEEEALRLDYGGLVTACRDFDVFSLD